MDPMAYALLPDVHRSLHRELVAEAARQRRARSADGPLRSARHRLPRWAGSLRQPRTAEDPA